MYREPHHVVAIVSQWHISLEAEEDGADKDHAQQTGVDRLLNTSIWNDGGGRGGTSSAGRDGASGAGGGVLDGARIGDGEPVASDDPAGQVGVGQGGGEIKALADGGGTLEGRQRGVGGARGVDEDLDVAVGERDAGRRVGTGVALGGRRVVWRLEDVGGRGGAVGGDGDGARVGGLGVAHGEPVQQGAGGRRVVGGNVQVDHDDGERGPRQPVAGGDEGSGLSGCLKNISASVLLASLAARQLTVTRQVPAIDCRGAVEGEQQISLRAGLEARGSEGRGKASGRQESERFRHHGE
jgi:hypothetical protein